MDLLLLLALLACPIGMGVMMWMMGRGQRNGSGAKTSSETGGQQQVAQLRAEIDQLKADRDADRVRPSHQLIGVNVRPRSSER